MNSMWPLYLFNLPYLHNEQSVNINFLRTQTDFALALATSAVEFKSVYGSAPNFQQYCDEKKIQMLMTAFAGEGKANCRISGVSSLTELLEERGYADMCTHEEEMGSAVRGALKVIMERDANVAGNNNSDSGEKKRIISVDTIDFRKMKNAGFSIPMGHGMDTDQFWKWGNSVTTGHDESLACISCNLMRMLNGTAGCCVWIAWWLKDMDEACINEHGVYNNKQACEFMNHKVTLDNMSAYVKRLTKQGIHVFIAVQEPGHMMFVPSNERLAVHSVFAHGEQLNNMATSVGTSLSAASSSLVRNAGIQTSQYCGATSRGDFEVQTYQANGLDFGLQLEVNGLDKVFALLPDHIKVQRRQRTTYAGCECEGCRYCKDVNTYSETRAKSGVDKRRWNVLNSTYDRSPDSKCDRDIDVIAINGRCYLCANMTNWYLFSRKHTDTNKPWSEEQVKHAFTSFTHNVSSPLDFNVVFAGPQAIIELRDDTHSSITALSNNETYECTPILPPLPPCAYNKFNSQTKMIKSKAISNTNNNNNNNSNNNDTVATLTEPQLSTVHFSSASPNAGMHNMRMKRNIN